MLLCISSSVHGQFGVNREKESVTEQIQQQGESSPQAQTNNNNPIATKLLTMAPELGEQDAVDLAYMIEHISRDPETATMITMLLKDEEQAANLQAFIKDLTPEQIVVGMKQSMEELKAIEILFSDPQRAVVEMDQEGMIEKKKLGMYQKNPELLEDDVRKSVYFTFVSLIVAGGFV